MTLNNYATYRDFVKKGIRRLMNSDPVVKLRLKALNNERDEEAVEQLVFDGYMLGTPEMEVLRQISDRAGVSEQLFEAYIKDD